MRKAMRTSEKRVMAILKARESDIRMEERNRTRAELTKSVVVDTRAYRPEPIILGKIPEQPYVNVAARPACSGLLEEWRWRSTEMQIITFKAVRKAWTNGKGVTVIWFDWEVVQ